MSRSAAIEAFLRSGVAPPEWEAWRGDAEAGQRMVRQVLQRILVHRASGAPLGRRDAPEGAGEQLVRRASAMLDGLLSPEEAAQLKRQLPGMVRVVTVDGFSDQVRELSVDDAWCLANIVLEDMGAPPLSDAAPQLDGLCLADQVWVPPGAFSPPTDRVDVLVHEVAHLLHTVSRERLELVGSGPVLEVPPVHHETFAYACELWACRELRPDGAPGDLDVVVQDIFLADARVNRVVLLELLRSAERAGWSALLALAGHA